MPQMAAWTRWRNSRATHGCLNAEGPRKNHTRTRYADKATHILHIDIAGPLTTSDDGCVCFLAGALRHLGYALLIDARLPSRASAEVGHQLDVVVSYFGFLCYEGFPLTNDPSIRRFRRDRVGEFLHIDEASTEPTAAAVSDKLYPLWGLIPGNG